MRRVYFDLIGLPPTPEEVEAYLKDSRPDAYERMVDRLLASPQYGERWAKYWLDSAGYADSHGKIDRDTVRPYAWRYRDYVIRSLNADKPYDRFLMEQIAGDELFDYRAAKMLTPEQRDDLIATGFLRTAADDTDEAVLNLVPYRTSVLADEVSIFSSAVMGLTMECARCHSHKYDPIPQRDYYRFMAILQAAYDPYDWRVSNNVTYAGGEGQVELPLQFQRFILDASDPEFADIKAYNAPIRAEIARLEAALDAKTALLSKQIREEKLSKFPESLRADVKKAFDDPEAKRTPLEKYLVQKFEPSLKVERKEVEERFKDFKEETIKARKNIQEIKARLKPEPKIQALFDTGGEPSPTYVLRRGDYRNPAARVMPGVPSALRDGIEPYRIVKPSWTTDTTGRRLALARWLVQPNHPLTARVMVNRIWLHHFGAGLVATPGNFGKTGAPPSHPELLDWLATEFVRHGWSLKAMHRLILTSTAYRQSSIAQPAQLESDPDDVLLSRFPLRRLDAEAIRDGILKVTGRLDPRQFGPADEVELTPEGEVISKGTSVGFRRSIYLLQRRSMPLTLLELFDAPRMDPNCLVRARSTVPTQALQLWNSDMLREDSRYFAGRVMEKVGDDIDKQVDQVYLTALSRWPKADEKQLGRQALTDLTKYWLEHLGKEVPAEPRPARARWLALANYCHTILNSAEFVYVD
jgi:hypothetical protein